MKNKITEKKLLDLGFKFVYDDVEDVKYLYLDIPNYYTGWDFSYYDNIIHLGDYPLPIKYIHQLEELYLLLTNEELNKK